MASQTARCLKMHWRGCPSKNVFFSSYHLYTNRTGSHCCAKPFSSSSIDRVPIPVCLLLRQTICMQQTNTNTIFPQREQPSVLSRWLSSKADHVQSFDSKDKCSIFDQNGMLVKETTFGQAKLFASSQNFRLVYMSKNPDGLLCFSLQQLPVKTEKGKAIEENTSELSRGKKKDTKAVAKEYKIKASIADRDLDIKLSQMHSHLSKGKQVIIFIKENKSQSSVLLVSCFLTRQYILYIN